MDRLVTAAPPPPTHVGSHFYWPSVTESPVLGGPVRPEGAVLGVARQLVPDIELAFDQTQVALNIPPYRHRPGRPHIDACDPTGGAPRTFTLLAAVFLTDQTGPHQGNLWIWPGTHQVHAAFFARSGPEAFNAAHGYPPIPVPKPVQIQGQAGDVLFAHYLLGHNIGGNYQSDQTRGELYWRLRAPGHAERWADCLADAWLEYPALQR